MGRTKESRVIKNFEDSKLTQLDVKAMREMRRAGAKLADIAFFFDITEVYACQLVLGVKPRKPVLGYIYKRVSLEWKEKHGEA